MSAPHKYIYFVLTTPQLELALAILKSHGKRLEAQKQNVAGTEAAQPLEPTIDKSQQVFDLMLKSLLLHRSRTKFIVTETQFNLICQSITQARQRVEMRLRPGSQANEAKHTLLNQLEELEATLGKADHAPTRFDISGADAFKNTELGMRFGPLRRSRLRKSGQNSR